MPLDERRQGCGPTCHPAESAPSRADPRPPGTLPSSKPHMPILHPFPKMCKLLPGARPAPVQGNDLMRPILTIAARVFSRIWTTPVVFLVCLASDPVKLDLCVVGSAKIVLAEDATRCNQHLALSNLINLGALTKVPVKRYPSHCTYGSISLGSGILNNGWHPQRVGIPV